MELALLLVFVLGLVVPLSIGVYNGFESGRIEIDRLQHPILYRVQRIVRARNVRARELEHSRRIAALEAPKPLSEEEVKFRLELTEKQATNKDELEKFQWELDADVREREAEEAKKKAEELAAAKQAELEAFTAAEKRRQEIYAANRQIEIELEREARLEELKARELNYYRATKDDDSSYGDRYVNLHGVYVRKLPHTESQIIANLSQGDRVSVDGWINSEVHWNNGIWFRLKANEIFPHGGWMWSGSLNKQSTSGLQNLNEHRETQEIRSFDGSVSYFHEEPTQMERMIEAEKQQNKKNNSGLITANHINATRITAGSIDTGWTTITRDGMSITQAGGLTAPRETEYSIMSTSNPYAARNTAEEDRKRRAEEERRRRDREDEDRRRRQQQDDAMRASTNLAMNTALFTAIF